MATKTVIVDGFKVRQVLDVEFLITDVHSENPTDYRPRYYIPEGERWVDYRFQDELTYLLEMERIFAPFTGIEYQRKRQELRAELKKKNREVEFKHNFKDEEGVKIWLVDGKVVRETIDPDFFFGGHEYVYSYVPRGEVWIDDRADPKDIPFVILHEVTERRLMEKENKSYDVAHGLSVEIEKEERRKHGASYPGDVDYAYSIDELMEYIKVK